MLPADAVIDDGQQRRWRRAPSHGVTEQRVPRGEDVAGEMDRITEADVERVR
jgi:hypothetical protein